MAEPRNDSVVLVLFKGVGDLKITPRDKDLSIPSVENVLRMMVGFQSC